MVKRLLILLFMIGENYNERNLIDGSWRNLVECKDADVDIFFPSNDDDPALEAKEYCGRCAVKSECLEYAMISRQQDGVYGGLTAPERRSKRRRDTDRERRQRRSKRQEL